MSNLTITPEERAVLLDLTTRAQASPKNMRRVLTALEAAEAELAHVRLAAGSDSYDEVISDLIDAVQKAEAENARLREKLESALDKIENIQDSDSYGVWEGVCHACGICAGCPEDWQPTDDHCCRVMLELWADGEPLPWEEAARRAVTGEGEVRE